MKYIDLINEQEKNDSWFLKFCKNWLFIHEVNAMPPVEGSNGKYFYILRIFPFGFIPILNHLVINIIYNDYTDYHNHPWRMYTLILWGGYKEIIINRHTGEKTIKNRRPGSFSADTKLDDFHRIELHKDKTISIMWKGFKYLDPKSRQRSFEFFVEETNETMPSYKYWARKGCTRQQQLDGVKVWYPRKWLVPGIVKRWFDYYNGK